MKIDLTLDDPKKGGIALDDLIKALSRIRPRDVSGFLPYGLVCPESASRDLVSRAVAVRDNSEGLWSFIRHWGRWVDSPEGYVLWDTIFRRGNTTEDEKKIIHESSQKIFDNLFETHEQLKKLGPPTGARVKRTGVPRCCKADIFFYWGNGDPEMLDEDGELEYEEVTRADLFLQFSQNSPERMPLNTVGIAVLRQDQADELGEDFLESIGWFRATETQSDMCGHEGVVVFIRNREGSDPIVKGKKRCQD